MARIRSVHPRLFTDESFVSVSQAARVLAIGIWTESDDHGVFEWKPVTLKMRLMPIDSVDIAALLKELAQANMVRKFDVDGRSYGAVRNFCLFQRPKSPKFVYHLPPELHKYVGADAPNGEAKQAHVTRFPQNGEIDQAERPEFPEKMEVAPQRKEEGGRMKGKRELRVPKSSTSPSPKPAEASGFPEFWSEYPRKVGKGAALAAYTKAIKLGTSPAALLVAVRRQKWPADAQFIPHAATWLNQGRFDDDPDAAAPDTESFDPDREARQEQLARLVFQVEEKARNWREPVPKPKPVDISRDDPSMAAFWESQRCR